MDKKDFVLKEPVLFIIFNRPETTIRVFEEIKAARPPRLYIAADGPRKDREGETQLCAETRKIATAVDWPCEVKTLFGDANKGCRNAVSSAITWFFENEPEGIILEDDCLPCPDFFRLCQEMLAFHREDTRIMHICGSNFQFGVKRGDASYHFSRIAHIWGWASWRRAWKLYDVDMRDFPRFHYSGAIHDIIPSRFQALTWLKIFESVHGRSPWFNTWDYQWSYTLMKEGGLAIVPEANLISNIGFSSGGAHTSPGSQSPLENIPHGKLDETLTHPLVKAPSRKAEDKVFRLFFMTTLLKITVVSLFPWMGRRYAAYRKKLALKNARTENHGNAK